jgi:hypothetical protein
MGNFLEYVIIASHFELLDLLLGQIESLDHTKQLILILLFNSEYPGLLLLNIVWVRIILQPLCFFPYLL